ncbi:MAG: hypothetical protein Kow00121_24460 [Elainellaceae cyanobacterium]
MPYHDRLKRWVVVYLTPPTYRMDVARFVKCSDAEGHAQALRRLNPERQYLVVFDPVMGEEEQLLC